MQFSKEPVKQLFYFTLFKRLKASYRYARATVLVRLRCSRFQLCACSVTMFSHLCELMSARVRTDGLSSQIEPRLGCHLRKRREVGVGRETCALLAATAPTSSCGRAGELGSQRGGQRGSLPVGVTPVHHCPPCRLHSCSASSASVPSPASLAGSTEEGLVTAGRGAVSRTGPDVVPCREGGGFC